MIDKTEIANVPSKPGVYFWKDKNDQIIYVGKAKNLKARMKQYFDPQMLNSYKTPKMLQEIASFEITVLNTEKEALMFERQSILKYKPFYNVLYPSQTSFPYLCIKKTKHELVIKIVSKYKKTKDTIFYGPLVSNISYKPLEKYLIHLLLSKDGMIVKKQSQEFINEGFELAKKLMKFDRSFKKELDNKILEAIDNRQYDLAKEYNDVLQLITKKDDTQNIELKTNQNFDVIGFFEQDSILFITIMNYRSSALINKTDFASEIKISKETSINEFLNHYYHFNELPDFILFPENYIFKELDLINLIKTQLTKQYRTLVDIANDNARSNLQAKIQNFITKQKNLETTIERLSSILGTSAKRLVIFDNSFLKGTDEVVGEACVYINGLLSKALSRAFILKKNNSRNADVEYMYQNAETFLSEYHKLVDLIIVDGNQNQINEVKRVCQKYNLNKPIFGLIKNDKHRTKVLVDINNQEINIPYEDVFNFLGSIQIEVDKYAKNYFNKRHRSKMFNNPLKNINGIGEKTINKLLDFFGTYNNIIEASLEELSKVISLKLAKKIKENF
ncbi:GIY-YIG nuclease family protein [Mycoplasma enhydrae]|uniref:GIY-YIG nuclease family protein n=1 Tax=Mycoplasma enhydrae TaxID=2499220 RepID=UPI0021E73D39|nr:GIY-YIG nuclease family protein [Mycoplasma enhydrae]MCV3753699.1 GIY-YIG nuclease family protein [Mycoplasma enhydrae]